MLSGKGGAGSDMPGKRKSSVPLWVRIVLVVPLPVIALLIYRAGQNPRQGLFESQALSGLEVSAVLPVGVRLPVYLPQSGFRIADTLQFYTSENLYEKINGRDAAFFRFGFVSLSFASYSGAGDAFVDVYAYRLNRRENALGIYAAERADQRENISVVDAGYRSGGALCFYRGPYYVQVISTESSASVEAGVAEIVDSLCRLIPTPVGPLAALGRFPSAGRVENSDGYFPDNAFGTDFMGEIFTTQYRRGGATLLAFRHQSDSAQAMFERYREFLGQSADPQGTITIDRAPVYRYTDYGEKVWIFVIDDVFAGLTGQIMKDEGEQLIGELAAGIRLDAVEQ